MDGRISLAPCKKKKDLKNSGLQSKIEKYAIERPENYLQCSWTLSDDLSGMSQSSGRFMLAFGRDDFGSGLTCGLSLGGHGTLELLRQSDVFPV